LDETLASVARRIGSAVALAHADLGSGHVDRDRETAALLGRLLPPMMRPGGLVVSDQELIAPELSAEPLPEGIAPGRYFFYRSRRV
jgi:hypothetical protein